MNTHATFAALLISALSLTAPAVAQDKAPPVTDSVPKEEPQINQAELEKQFEKTMSGATMVGRFTVEGRGNANGREPKEDRYQINKVTKMKGDYWLFAARVQYGTKDVTVPIMLQVKWAGDTPVITLTDMNIPGLGTYTARVMVFRDHYAGYWSGGDHGGQMWGRIEHEASDTPEAPKAPDAPPAPRNPAPPGPTVPNPAK
jgi:hypothetical protein